MEAQAPKHESLLLAVAPVVETKLTSALQLLLLVVLLAVGPVGLVVLLLAVGPVGPPGPELEVLAQAMVALVVVVLVPVLVAVSSKAATLQYSSAVMMATGSVEDTRALLLFS